MNIYFSGIGGVAIGPLAEIAHDAGYRVAGSDREASLMTKQLEKRGITVSIGQDGQFLRQQHEKTPIDWFVYTSALPNDHPELLLARELGIRTSKRDELLAHIIAEKNLRLIAVAGTHGKTTTTGMLVWMFQQLGVPISYSVGTTLSFGPSGMFNPRSEYFVYECDEFDRNFLHFYPNIAIITSVEYDHPDTYPTEADYKSAFRQFIQQSQQVVMWQSDADYLNSHSPQSWNLQDNEVLAFNLAGEHNRRNATLAFKAFEYLGLAEGEKIHGWIDSFPGTGRRFEKLADNLYSDYGHHPVEIAATLQMARELSDHVVLVYQPHQNIRQHEIKGQYTDEIFKDAEAVYWLPTYLSREDPNLPVLTPQQLSANLHNVTVAEPNDALWCNIQQARQNGKLVLCMGAGTIDGWVRQHLDRGENV